MKGSSSWAALHEQRTRRRKPPVRSRDIPLHLRTHIRRSDKIAGKEQDLPGRNTDWMHRLSWRRRPLLQNALQGTEKMNDMTWQCPPHPHLSCKFKVHIPLFGFKEQGSTSCLWGDSQSALILQECPKAWGPASTSPESHRKSSPRFPLKFPQRPQVCPAHLGLSCIKTSGDITRGCPRFYDLLDLRRFIVTLKVLFFHH